MGLWDDHKPFWVIGGIVFVVDTVYSAFRGGGYESVFSGLIVGAVCGGIVEIGLRKVKGEIL
jgi:hypothetical protein